MRRSDNRLLVGVYALLHVDRSAADQVGQSDELVRETSVAVLPLRLPDDFCVDDRVPVHRIATEQGKRQQYFASVDQRSLRVTIR